jgi:hypothetical protein
MGTNYSLLGSPELIEDLATWKDQDGIRVGRPQPATTLVDAVDAPIGPETILPVLAAITVVCGSTQAVVELVDKILAMIASRRAESAKETSKLFIDEVVVVDPLTGKEIVRIKTTAPKEELVKSLTGS